MNMHIPNGLVDKPRWDKVSVSNTAGMLSMS